MTPEYVAARLSHFTKEMSIFKHMMDEFNQVRKSFDTIPLQMPDILKDIVELKEYVNQLLNNHHILATKSATSFEDSHANLAKLSDNQDKFNKDLADVHLDYRASEARMNEIYVKLKYFENRDKLITKNAEDLDLFTTKLNQFYLKFDEKLHQLDFFNDKINSQIALMHKVVMDKVNDLLDLAKKSEEKGIALDHGISSFQRGCQENIGNLAHKLDQYILEQSVSKGPKIQDVIDATIDLKNDLLNQIGNLKLEAQNATLRTTNGQSQIQILEKKIENIFLVLKKIELAKSNE